MSFMSYFISPFLSGYLKGYKGGLHCSLEQPSASGAKITFFQSLILCQATSFLRVFNSGEANTDGSQY